MKNAVVGAIILVAGSMAVNAQTNEIDELRSTIDSIRDLTWVNNETYTKSCSVNLPIKDAQDNAGWRNDGALCGSATKHFEFSDSGPVRGKRCTRLNEPFGSPVWDDNYLCTDYDFPYELRFSIHNRITTVGSNGGCLHMPEHVPAQQAWDDNYLCWQPSNSYASVVRHIRLLEGRQRGLELPEDPLFAWKRSDLRAYVDLLEPFEALLDLFNSSTVAERAALAKVLKPEESRSIIEANELIFTWALGAPLPNQQCTLIYEKDSGFDGSSFYSNETSKIAAGERLPGFAHLCANRDVGLKWSLDGELAGMRCFPLNEPKISSGKDSQLWSDNFLCAPEDFDYDVRFVTNGRIEGIQDKCLSIRTPDAGPVWNDNFICYDRDKLGDFDGHWEAATPPCPSCPEIDYQVSYGVEEGKETSSESSFGIEISLSVEEDDEILGTGVSAEQSISSSASFSSAVAESFSRSKTEDITVPCHLGQVWQWVSVATRDCAFGVQCPAITARSSVIQCTVPGDEPIHDPSWSPCEPVFVDNLSATLVRSQNSGSRSDLPGGWRCRGVKEIIVEQATYGRSCNAPVGNVTDRVAINCQGGEGQCHFIVDMAELGRPGGNSCEHNFEAFYSCPGDGDRLRSAFVSGEAGYGTKVSLACGSDDSKYKPVVLEGDPRPAQQVEPNVATDETAAAIRELAETLGRTTQGTGTSEDGVANAIRALATVIQERPTPKPADTQLAARALQDVSAAIREIPTPPVPNREAENRIAAALEALAIATQRGTEPVPATPEEKQASAAVVRVAAALERLAVAHEDLPHSLGASSLDVAGIMSASLNRIAEALPLLQQDQTASDRVARALEQMASASAQAPQIYGALTAEFFGVVSGAIRESAVAMATPNATDQAGAEAAMRSAAALEALARNLANLPSCPQHPAGQCGPENFQTFEQESFVEPNFQQPEYVPEYQEESSIGQDFQPNYDQQEFGDNDFALDQPGAFYDPEGEPVYDEESFTDPAPEPEYGE
ncbi:hypothetical protein AIOL_002078 [Candidatus Rhodobacter oscarellae]|uniref:CEL-III C-terminal domain-containing protein n=1 Tax=Candidatus Rhodobacter oscarellae TaxID=1675527 RepID=A0A0J9E5R2_9RHOB|nr:hypothetical protein [Candidatus Rhodobacter lobularis]KMW57119.1 hypothetical protein AIOL_002078 [Candidatus Rhodobacter lobularis]